MPALSPLSGTAWAVSSRASEAVCVRLPGAVPYRTTDVAGSFVSHCTVAVLLPPTDADTLEITGGVVSEKYVAWYVPGWASKTA